MDDITTIRKKIEIAQIFSSYKIEKKILLHKNIENKNLLFIILKYYFFKKNKLIDDLKILYNYLLFVHKLKNIIFIDLENISFIILKYKNDKIEFYENDFNILREIKKDAEKDYSSFLYSSLEYFSKFLENSVIKLEDFEKLLLESDFNFLEKNKIAKELSSRMIFYSDETVNLDEIIIVKKDFKKDIFKNFIICDYTKNYFLLSNYENLDFDHEINNSKDELWVKLLSIMKIFKEEIYEYSDFEENDEYFLFRDILISYSYEKYISKNGQNFPYGNIMIYSIFNFFNDEKIFNFCFLDFYKILKNISEYFSMFEKKYLEILEIENYIKFNNDKKAYIQFYVVNICQDCFKNTNIFCKKCINELIILRYMKKEELLYFIEKIKNFIRRIQKLF